MRVFISWSDKRGDRVAAELRGWLPRLFPGLTVYSSNVDVNAGGPGLSILMGKLRSADLGIVVVTPESNEAPWSNFEAGALCRKKDRMAVPLVIDMEIEDLVSPLRDLQVVKVGRVDFFRMLQPLTRVSGSTLDERALRRKVNRHWKELEPRLAKIASSPRSEAKGKRPRFEDPGAVVITVTGASDDRVHVSVRNDTDQVVSVDSVTWGRRVGLVLLRGDLPATIAAGETCELAIAVLGKRPPGAQIEIGLSSRGTKRSFPASS